MPVKQISINMENTPGKLSTVSELLGKEGVNICAISIAESADSSIVRIICSDPDRALGVLKSKGHAVQIRDVLAVRTPDHPGGLNAMLKPLAAAGVNVDYLYSCLRRIEDDAIIILSVSDMDRSLKVLAENWIQTVNEEIYSI
ncbi:MAG: amino acid-binding protein [bacterium]